MKKEKQEILAELHAKLRQEFKADLKAHKKDHKELRIDIANIKKALSMAKIVDL